MEEVKPRRLSRKEMLKLGLLGSAALALPLQRAARTELTLKDRLPSSRVPSPFQVGFVVPPVLSPVRRSEQPGIDPVTGRRFSGTDLYRIEMRSNMVEIIPGLKTEIYGYNGITPGPTISVARDRRTVVRQINALPATNSLYEGETTTSVHLHGSASKPQYDGYASDTTRPDFYKDYRYPNFQVARTLWYHDHGVHHTAQNAYMGLAAQYHLHDQQELSLPIPHGRYDVPLIIADKVFASDGRLIFDDQGHSTIMGDVILVNGKPWPVMEVERRKYRFRILNASVSRSYELALSKGEDNLTVIGHDGGLAPHPVSVNSFRIGMAERYEVVIDFEKYAIGDKIILQNLGPDNNEDFPSTKQVMRFDVVREASDRSNNSVPADLDPQNEVMSLTESDATPETRRQPRQLNVVRHNGHWTVNGKTWDDIIASGFKDVAGLDPAQGAVEIWEVNNNSGGWFHPVHIHLIDFKVLERDGQPPHPYERGPKDTIYAGEGEHIRVIARFGPQTGRYMVHCHNLVHEDHDMMVQFNVGNVDFDNDPNDPIKADPAKPLPEGPLTEDP